MAAVAVSAELKFRGGLREKISVNVGNNLSSLISGIHELHTNISQLLSELVEREKSRGDRAHGEEDEDDSDEDELEGPLNSDLHPPTKRAKT